MGALSNGQCFSTDAQAAQAVCGSSYPVSSAGASAPVLVTCQGVTSAPLALSLARQDGSVSVLISQTLSFPDCDPMEPFNDAMLLWGAGIAALALVWCFKTFILKLVTNQ